MHYEICIMYGNVLQHFVKFYNTYSYYLLLLKKKRNCNMI